MFKLSFTCDYCAPNKLDSQTLIKYEVLYVIVLHKYKHCIVIYLSINMTIQQPHHYLNCREQNSEEFYKLQDFQKFGVHSKSFRHAFRHIHSPTIAKKKKKITLQWSAGGCLVKGFGKGNVFLSMQHPYGFFPSFASCSTVGDQMSCMNLTLLGNYTTNQNFKMTT